MKKNHNNEGEKNIFTTPEKSVEAARLQMSVEIRDALKEVKDGLKNSLLNLEYFFNFFENLYNPGHTIKPDKKIIAHTCLQVPDEFIYALDAWPVRICTGFSSLGQIGSNWLPARTCPLVRSTLGGINSNIFPYYTKPNLTISAVTCDAKRKMGELTNMKEDEFYTLDFPVLKNGETTDQYWLQSLNKLITQLEKTTGKKLTKKRLKDAIALVNSARKEFRRLLELRKNPKIVIYGTHAMLATNSWFYDHARQWTEAMKSVNDEIEALIKEDIEIVPPHAPRLLMTGSPSIFPNIKSMLIAEQSGGIVVADEFCSSGRLLYDTVAVDEWNIYDMVPAIADRYLKPCLCPTMTPNDDNLRKLEEDIKAYKVDGVIYQAFSGCMPYEIESFKVGKMLGKLGVPMLYLETDYGKEDIGQLTTRIEAFIESIKSRKRNLKS